MPIADSTAHARLDQLLKRSHREAYTGWVIGQDLKGVAGDFDVQAQRSYSALLAAATAMAQQKRKGFD